MDTQLPTPIQSPRGDAPITSEPQTSSMPASSTGWPRWYLVLIVAGVLLAIGAWIYYFLSASSPTSLLTPPSNSPSPTQFTINPGKIIIGTDATYPPMEYRDANGQLTGYDIDLGNRLAGKLNLQAEFRNIAWDDLFNALNQGEIDIVISSVTITDERKAKHDFSDPYINAGQVIITRDNETSISTVDDLTGKKIAVQKGTTNEEEAKKYTDPEKVIAFEDFVQATQALLKGEADAIISDLTGAKGIVSENPELKISSDPFTSEYFGIVIRKNNSELVNKINTALTSLRQQGVLALLKQKWLE